MTQQVAPYGTWVSPVAPDTFTERDVSISQLRIDGPDIYWVEDNPRRQGRSVLLRKDALGQTMEVLPMLEGSRLVHVATNVHERGGRAYAAKDGLLVISDGTDNRVYGFRVSDRKKHLLPLTPVDGSRYGDFEIDLGRGLVYAVREHLNPGEEELEHTLVAIPLDGSAARDASRMRTVFSGTDFVSAPTLSPDGSKLAWITWMHPHMPWTESELRVASVDPEGMLISEVTLLDHPGVSAYEPRWTLDGDLIHVDDSTGWANFYKTEGFSYRSGEPADAWTTRLRTRALRPGPQAFSQPHWQLGQHSFDTLDEDHLVCSWTEGGQRHIGTIRLDNGSLEEWHLGWYPAGNVAAQNGRVIFLGDARTKVPAILEVENGRVRVLRPSTESGLVPGSISEGRPVEWKNRHGDAVYGTFYEPRNQDYKAPEGARPPLLVHVNPVPTTQATPGWDLAVQFWTTRGFAVLEANPHGSTGWGLEYAAALDGQWGVLDVEDIIDGAAHMAAEGIVDGKKMAVHGAVLGGITVLRALEMSDVFSAGVIVSGAVNVKDLARKAHKFASHYPQWLMGSSDLTEPVWAERNPVNRLEDVDAPLLLLHGGRDKAASVEETQGVYDSLKKLGKPVALKVFPEEGSRFIHDRAIVVSREAELCFYGMVWDLNTHSDATLRIANFNE